MPLRSSPKPSIRRPDDRQGSVYGLVGDWTAEHAQAAMAALASLRPKNQPYTIDGASVGRLDITGAWLLVDYVGGNRQPAVKLKNFDDRATHFLEQAQTLRQLPETPAPPCPSLLHTGLARLDRVSGSLIGSITFLGEFWLLLGNTIRHPRDFRFRAFVNQCDVAAVRAAPIAAFMTFLIAIVLSYQGAAQLRRFGAEIFSIDLVTISVLREMGVLLTAIMVAGRSGSAFAAEIGTMKLNEELDALKTTGMEPMEVLVLPRVLALTVMMPLLTFFGNITALLGSGLLTVSTTTTGWALYYARLTGALHMKDFWIGLGKAPVFGLMIALVGCYHGMAVANSAESVGRETTNAVVHSIFLVMLADALFSIVFTQIGI